MEYLFTSGDAARQACCESQLPYAAMHESWRLLGDREGEVPGNVRQEMRYSYQHAKFNDLNSTTFPIVAAGSR